ncbi:hypothetical protein WMY93_002417 [Mugilogobius chulae]|uniref:Gypsy retrotransposon integrase-like protein 1 n=1 Tax=Mugilogobius chulae TaxID=88201 RepID=A0AAW0PZL1_9GOBI
MNNIRPPEELKLSGNVNENWKAFRQSFELYLLAAGLEKEAEPRKIALLLTVAGRSALDVYNTFQFASEDDRKLNNVLTKFEEYCTPRKNETYERYVFRNRMQADNESIEQYIVIGVHDKRVRMLLLKEIDLTLEKAISTCQASESTKLQLKSFDNDGDPATVDAVKKGVNKAEKRHFKDSKEKRKDKDCERCGTKHAVKQCPAYGKDCRKCGGKNHFARCCFTKKKVHAVRQEKTASSGDEDEPLYLDALTLTDMDGNEDEWIAHLNVNGVDVPLKIDTGAEINVMPLKLFNRLSPKPHVRRKKLNLRAYNNQPIPHKGVFRATIKGEGRSCNALFVLVEEDRQPILGLKASKQMGLIKRIHVIDSTVLNNTNTERKDNTESPKTTSDIVKKYSDVFHGVGCLPNTYKIQLKDNAEPVIHPARKVPVALKERLRKELQTLIEKGIIRKVEEPTDWVNSLVIVEKKNGDLRLCIDPRDLNKWIKREHFKLPTKSDITSAMAGARYFSKLDASSGFYQIKLDEESAKLCTFNTPFGRHCFLRMPFGIASAPEVFHRTVQQIFDGMEGVGVFLDDVVIWGTTQAEHDERLAKVMLKAKQSGLKLNRQKCQFGVSEITYLGDKLSAAGIQPDPEKVRAITDMPIPENKTDLQRALGLVNYVGRFIPNLSANTKALRSLLENSTEWHWNHEHNCEWETLKSSLVREPVLKFYDPALSTKVSTDASKDGLGAVLLQQYEDAWFPVAYASRTMTAAERNYAQIEKETLGAVFGCEKFHEYIYGREVVLETDHKPLIAISTKPLGEAPPRIQRLLLRLQKYSLTFEFTPGKHLVMADALSRASLNCTGPNNTEHDVQVHVDTMQKHMPVSKDKWRQIAEATAKDSQLQNVIKMINLPGEQKLIHPYQNFKEELSVIQGVLLKGKRIVVPAEMRSQMLQLTHEGHLGIEKCKRRARALLYWPHMNNDIENYIKRCETCQKHRYQQQKEPLLAHQRPDKPWSKVGVDLFYLSGKNYLVMIDYFSNFPEVAFLTETSAAQVIKHCKAIFARHGIPVTLISDNGPQFSSQEFKDFAENYGFEHTTSSPLYPQSNGLAEKAVQIVKRLFKKATETCSDPYLALLNYRTSPLENGKSPAELLMNRELRTRLPSASQLLRKEKELSLYHNKQSQVYNKTAKPLSH